MQLTFLLIKEYQFEITIWNYGISYNFITDVLMFPINMHKII